YPPTDGIICYTDGSKIDGFSGAGYFCENLNLKRSISTGQLATVHQTELFAISDLCNANICITIALTVIIEYVLKGEARAIFGIALSSSFNSSFVMTVSVTVLRIFVL